MTKAEAIKVLTHLYWWTAKTAAENEAVLMAMGALEESSRIEQALHGKTPEEQLDFLKWFMYDYPKGFTQSQIALIDWLKGENR